MALKMMMSAVAAALALGAFARTPNYDESKVGPYTLEDPLVFADGRKLVSPADWPARRAEIVKIFEKEMFGRTPPKPEAVVTELREEGPTLAGLAIRRQYRMWFKRDKSGPFIDWLVVIPNRINGDKPVEKGGKVVCENTAKVPVVLFLNYRGNQEMLTDREVFLPEGAWLRNHPERNCFDHRVTGASVGAARQTTAASPFPIETIVARGYALMTACYGQISPDVEVRKGDREDFAYTGVFSLWPKRDPKATDNTTAIGAWAWALSRGLDLAETIPEIDAKKSVATGCSRLAKTPLLACSRDERFAVCVPCQTGGGGCPLAKRDFGENVSTEIRAFPHWYCRAYDKYDDNEQAMKFDQHLLIASIAPRAILVEGFNSGWFDTKGEYLACRAASPAWEFLGMKGLPEGDFPANFDTSLIGPNLGYVRRGGQHGISGSDWNWTLDFADRVFERNPVADVFKRYVDGKRIAGVVSVLSDADYDVRIDCAGWAADYGTPKARPMTADTLFAIFSMTKTFTGTAVMCAIDEGKLSLDDEVSKYLPEFADVKMKDGTKPKRPLKLRDLGTHTSGSRKRIDCVNRSIPLREVARQLAAEPLQFQPGETFAYGNGWIDTLAACLEVAVGEPYERYLQRKVLDPLEMKDTTFWPNDEQLKRLVSAYTTDDKPIRPAVDYCSPQIAFPKQVKIYPAASAGLFSTPLDMVRFSQMLAHHGEWKGRRIVSRKTFDTIFSVIQVPKNLDKNYTVGSWLYGDWFGHEGAMRTDQRANLRTGQSRVFFIQTVNAAGSAFFALKKDWHAACDRMQGTPAVDFKN